MIDTENINVDGFILIHFKAEALAAHELPNIAYPMPTEVLAQQLTGSGMLKNKQILAYIQQYTAHGEVKNWQDYLPAMHALTRSLEKGSGREMMH